MVGETTRRGWLALALFFGAALPASSAAPAFPAFPNLDTFPDSCRPGIQTVLAKTALKARGPYETFNCAPNIYRWLLDHPDRTVQGWQRIGAKSITIDALGDGRYGYKDSDGNDVHWDLVHRGTDQRIWYAEGVVKPAPLVPKVGVKAIFVMHIVEGRDARGRPVMHHQGELFLHTDSKTAALITKILGASAPRMAEQYVGQIQVFFAGLAWFLFEHPERVKEVLAE